MARPYKHAAAVADLRARILDGTHQPGEQLPSLPQIRQTYGIGDRAARAAIQELVSQGLAITRIGHGTYVRGGDATPQNTPAGPPAPPRARRTHAARRLNPADAPTPGDEDLTPTAPVATADEQLPPDVALALDADPAEPITVERVILCDQAGPVAVRTTYRTAGDPHQAQSVVTHTTARRPTETEARALGTTRAAIVLIHDETHHDRTHPVAFVRTVYPADTIRLADHYRPQT